MRVPGAIHLELPGPLALEDTLSAFRVGGSDPSIRMARDGVWRASRTVDGPATVQVEAVATDDHALTARAWGPGADRALSALPDLLGFDDDPDTFVPAHPLIEELHHRNPGLRHGRSGAVLACLVPSILEQRVTTGEAHSAYHLLVRRYSEDAPGPADLRLPPDPVVLSQLGYAEFHPLGIERRRADLIRLVSRRATSLERLIDRPPSEAAAALQSISGIGPWTTAIVTSQVLGDRDAVLVGDFHLPHLVSWALAGERRGSDGRMIELLEPYRGRRARAITLIVRSGIRPERRAPRARRRSIAGI